MSHSQPTALQQTVCKFHLDPQNHIFHWGSTILGDSTLCMILGKAVMERNDWFCYYSVSEVGVTLTFYNPASTKLNGVIVYIFHLVHVSICLSVHPSLYCIFYNTNWIHFIFTNFINQLKVYAMVFFQKFSKIPQSLNYCKQILIDNIHDLLHHVLTTSECQVQISLNTQDLCTPYSLFIINCAKTDKFHCVLLDLGFSRPNIFRIRIWKYHGGHFLSTWTFLENRFQWA